MKLKNHLISPALLLLFVLLCCGGCSTTILEEIPLEPHLITEEIPEASPSENNGSACYYFYFL